MGEATTVRLRDENGSAEFDLSEVTGAAFWTGLLPWRTMRSRHGQAHFPGLYWSSVMADHVGYESRLELAWLLLADRDPRWTKLVSQPFQLVTVVDGSRRRHVPDFLAVRDDGLVCVVDVKPRHRLKDPLVRSTFGWTRRLVERQGWAFEVFSEPDPVVLANVRFLSGYRRSWQFDSTLLEILLRCAAIPAPLALIESTAAVEHHSPAVVRAHLLHLLWCGQLHCDLGSPLAGSTLVEAR